MPDRDVFDRNVSRGWKHAARLIIGHDEDPNALRSVIRALGQELKRDGCPGVDIIVQIVTDALQSTDRQCARRQAAKSLERVRREEASGTTETVVVAAQRLIAQPPWGCDDTSPQVVAVHLLADLVDARLCPAPMLGLLVEEGGMSFQTLHSRLERAKAMLVAAPEVHRLAEMVLVDPSGSSVKQPRIRRTKTSQADLLVTALTES